MGFLTINGVVLSYAEYADRVELYKEKGLE